MNRSLWTQSVTYKQQTRGSVNEISVLNVASKIFFEINRRKGYTRENWSQVARVKML